MNRHRQFKFAIMILGLTIIPLLFNLYKYIWGGSVSTIQCMASSLCLLGWFLISFYGSKNKQYLIFIFIYWGIDITLSIIIFLANTYSSINLMLLAPLVIWFDGPFYGLELILKHLIVIMPIIKLINCLLGYLLGRKLSQL